MIAAAPPGLAAARAWFDAHDLPQPYLPSKLAEAMRVVGEHTFSTRAPLPSAPFWLTGWLEELDAGEVPDYAVVALDGRGGSNQAVHLYVVIGPLAVFVQVPWGTPFGDPAAQRDAMARVFDAVAPLLRAAEARAGEPRRHVLVVSGFERSGWRALPGGTWRREDFLPGLRAALGVD